MPILRTRNKQTGSWQNIPALVGPKGEPFKYEDFTPEQLESLKGKDGYTPIKGVDYFDGVNGTNGKDGANGKDGYTPRKGIDYFDGQNGKDGKDGTNGKDGVDGKDYVITEADYSAIADVVLTKLPVAESEEF